jgi:hypothetical protein
LGLNPERRGERQAEIWYGPFILLDLIVMMNSIFSISREFSFSSAQEQNLLSSRSLSKNLKIRIYKTIILPVVLYGCETWSLTLKKEHRLGVFENRVLRRRMEKTA